MGPANLSRINRYVSYRNLSRAKLESHYFVLSNIIQGIPQTTKCLLLSTHAFKSLFKYQTCQSVHILGYKSGDIYKSYGDDIYPEFTSHYDDSVIAIKTHTYSAAGTREYKFKRALVSKQTASQTVCNSSLHSIYDLKLDL